MALPFGEDSDQHVGARHLVTAGRLDVDHRPLDDALEAGGRFGVLAIVRDEIGKLIVDVVLEIMTKDVEIDAARAHDGCRILVVDEREEKVLEGCIFVATLIGNGERTMKRLFETA